jgi:hypothetical protein
MSNLRIQHNYTYFKYDHLRILLLSTTTLVYDNIEMDIQKNGNGSKWHIPLGNAHV